MTFLGGNSYPFRLGKSFSDATDGPSSPGVVQREGASQQYCQDAQQPVHCVDGAVGPNFGCLLDSLCPAHLVVNLNGL